MTIATQSRTAGPFECNGSTTVYPFTFKVFTASDVSVIFRNTASGGETKLVLNIDYTVALNSNQNANPGGSITINGPAYESGNTLTLTSELQYLQPTDLTNNGGFYPKVISDALDRLTIFTQQIRGLATRSLKFPISDGNLDATVPGKDQRKGRVLAFDAVTGLPMPGPLVEGIGAGANYIGESAPTSAYSGMRWYNPAIPTTFVYYIDGDSAQWVEEASQSTDGGLRADINADPAHIGFVTKAFGVVDKYGATADGIADDAVAFANCHAANGYVMLSPGKRYFITSLPNLASLKVIGNGATIVYDRLLIDRTFTMLDLSDVNFDAQDSNLTRCVRIRANSNIKFRKVNGYNINSTTFVRMFDISTENVNIDIEDCYCEDLAAAENSIVGDNNGACRFIYVGDEGGALVAPSRGRIINIRGKNLLPREDGDMIHIQSSDSAVFDIVVDNIYGENVAKRLVKVQANGVAVSQVHADARSNPVSMYSVVSHYGLYGSVRDVSGVGKFDHGVDTQYESTQIESVNVTNTGTAVSQGAALKGAGGMFARNITGYGFEHIVGNYNSLVAGANTDIQGVFGTSTGVAAFVRAAVTSGRVEIEDIKAVQGSGSRLCQVTRTSANTFTIVDIKDIIGDSGLFTAIDVTGAAVAKVKNVDINQTVSGNPVTINGGEAYLEDITGRGTTTDPVFLNATTKAVVTRARGGTSAQVLTTGCNNTIVNNAICAAGVPASRNTSTASTNTQNVGTLTFV